MHGWHYFRDTFFAETLQSGIPGMKRFLKVRETEECGKLSNISETFHLYKMLKFMQFWNNFVPLSQFGLELGTLHL